MTKAMLAIVAIAALGATTAAEAAGPKPLPEKNAAHGAPSQQAEAPQGSGNVLGETLGTTRPEDARGDETNPVVEAMEGEKNERLPVERVKPK
ncbi:hypothetical protein [Acuticoccus mangrovi]|uniref:Uncharacterized protein n=1 Tax=Acuticoccus mangrovi TaxID=2796142 RepID=A0A934IHV4_9HYPH|nr:hypothetical protein [Acuticoccus mangrovi]MBJ3775276.1 hypothetical protein [Acuticoccus mangrovi]